MQVVIKHLNGQTLKIKKFGTKQERNIYFNERNIGNNIEIKNEFYTVRSIMRKNDLFVLFVKEKEYEQSTNI